MHEDDAAQQWEARYAGAGQIWSGNPNVALVQTVADLPVGRALDLGCGEGADAVWLARHGWRVTAVDISPTAIARGTAAASAAGVPAGQLDWVVADLAQWHGTGPYDLVTASFLHSTAHLPRTDILRRAATLVAPGGHLFVLSHAAAPPWSEHRHHHAFNTLDEEVAALARPPSDWETHVAETRSRAAIGPDGQAATLDDVVVLLHRVAVPPAGDAS